MGLRPGDLIAEINRRAVTDVAALADEIVDAQAAGRRSVLLLVNRRGDFRFIGVAISTG